MCGFGAALSKVVAVVRHVNECAGDTAGGCVDDVGDSVPFPDGSPPYSRCSSRLEIDLLHAYMAATLIPCCNVALVGRTMQWVENYGARMAAKSFSLDLGSSAPRGFVWYPKVSRSVNKKKRVSRLHVPIQAIQKHGWGTGQRGRA